ncbi:hypothetical protein HPC49_10510 [Pyxidicoccus fallax]|uniref:Uncharacterized protein n=1 Tax=Pyxidicoccus fallax TaxID=394095 RepID=A0A848LT66_9BACT|nr:hypothetical protein [Pyxidicoccus fallax]NMO21178.1 hypothetical protein [Pyxidicoccus fallax]NPC78675.1 hypothetical protein [Pyxidicoccus fallax]
MNKLLGIASLVLASAALGVSLWGSGEKSAPAPVVQEAPVGASPADVEDLERRVRALEDTTLGLSRRLIALEQRPVVSADGGVVAGAPAALTAELEQLRAEVRSMVAGEALNSEGGRAYLKDAVRAVQDEMRTEQRETRQQAWMQTEAQAQTQRNERVRKFVSDARLNYNQEQTLTRRLQAEDTKRQALLQEVSAGTKSPRDVRQELRAEREQTDREMNALLDEGQKAQYQELRREERPMRGAGWGRGGGAGAQQQQQP